MEKFFVLFVIALCGTGTLASSFNAERESRIVNGQPAINQMQYVISLQKLSEVTHYFRGHRCGGALITLQHAVTAASCNYDNGTSVAINPAEYRVFAGLRNLTLDNSSYLFRRIRNITVHPLYLPSTPYRNDIAVIFLVQAFSSVAPTLRPVLLANRELYVDEPIPCNVAGWGAQNNTHNASVTLMQFNKRPSGQGNCRALYVGQIDVVDTMMCAAGVQQTHFAGCTGDIGNPLVCRNQLFGILIYNKNCTASAEPEVYTRIYRYNSWINSLIETPAAPGRAFTFQPKLTVLAVITFAQIIISSVSS